MTAEIDARTRAILWDDRAVRAIAEPIILLGEPTRHPPTRKDTR